MFEILKKKLYFAKAKVLINKAWQEGKITEFEPEIYEKMKGTIIACFPVSIYIKYSDFLFPKGTCYERSLYMFLALDDALLVRGENLDLLYNFGPGHGGHGWVEIGDYVYDPSLMLKYDKETYYKIFGCSDVFKINKKDYMKDHQEFYDTHVTTDLNEFRPGGKRRLELGILVRQHRKIAALSGNKEFQREMKEYLDSIQYDSIQIQQERDRIIDDLLNSERKEFLGASDGPKLF